MTNAEQHERLCDILCKLVDVDVLDCEELALLAHHAGIKINEFYPEPKIIELERMRTA